MLVAESCDEGALRLARSGSSHRSFAAERPSVSGLLARNSRKCPTILASETPLTACGLSFVDAALEAIILVEFELPGEKRKAAVCVNGGEGSETRRVLQALGAKLEAPRSPDGVEDTVH